MTKFLRKTYYILTLPVRILWVLILTLLSISEDDFVEVPS